MGRKKSYKIFDIDYLQTAELTEDDLYYLFDTQSLNYSLLIDMFRRTKQSLTDEKKIIKMVKDDKDWMYKYFWTPKQRDDFIDLIVKVYENVYYYQKKEALQRAQWWIFMYGFSNTELKRNKNISKLEE